MKCSKAKELLSAMLDGELGRSEEEAVLRHVEKCEECKRELEELRRLRYLLGALPFEPLPLHVKMAVLSAIGAEGRLASEGLSCEEARQAMHLLLDGDAPEALEGALRAHLAVCRDCAREFEELRRGVELARSLPKAEPPSWVLSPERYVGGGREEAVRRAAWAPTWLSLRTAYAYAVAAAVLAALVALGIWRASGGAGPAGAALPASPPRVALAPKAEKGPGPEVKARKGEGVTEEKRAVRARPEATTPKAAQVEEIGKGRPAGETKAVSVRPVEQARKERAQGQQPTAVEMPTRTRPPMKVAPRRKPAIEAVASRPEGQVRHAGEEAPPRTVVIRRLAKATAGGGQEPREVQKEEMRGVGPKRAVAAATTTAPPAPEEELRIEPSSTEGEGTKVALGGGAQGGIEILKFEF